MESIFLVSNKCVDLTFDTDYGVKKISCTDKGFIPIGRFSVQKIVDRCYLIEYMHSCDAT